ncbi:MAG: sterol desaturase family protein [Bacteroidota bacterium]
MNNLPTPWEIFTDPITLTILGLYVALYLWETFFPRNRHMPKIRYATLRGIVAMFVFFMLGTYLPIFTDGFLAQYQLIDLSGLHLALQTAIGLMVYQLALYFWHRGMHRSNILWRMFHQMHHSSERIDIPSTFYFSPVDMIGFTLLGSLVFALVIGLSAPAITVVILSLNFLSIFQHANISTPSWLGYVIQRPEQHAVHHERGVHQYNYSDFPIYDLIFGTFQNPKDFQKSNGFYDGASARILEMISFKDIDKQKSA